MQFIDLKTQYARIKDKVDSSIMQVLEHGKYVFGPEITELEDQLAKYTGRNYCLACSSGTDALLIPLMAWEIGRGDAVFTTPFTFVATAEVISLTGATPVFIDIDKDTYNIDAELLEIAIKKVISEGKLNAKAIIPVDLFGLPADYDAIIDIAKKYNLKILEDGAQGFGGSYKGKKVCHFGEAAGTSFFPAKPLGAYGDGGAAFTDDEELFEIFQSIRVHGYGGQRYDNVRLGINGRMDSIQAAVLLAKLEIFDEEIELRNKVAKRYSQGLKNKVVIPKVPVGYESAWAQYSVLAENSNHRQEIQDKLKEANIPSAIYYPIPLHLQTAYQYLAYKKGDMPITENISERIFSLPMHPYLKDKEIDEICDII